MIWATRLLFMVNKDSTKNTSRRVNGFFYGLFMDNDILRKLGITPTGAHRAYVDDYRLVIGNRATLVSMPGTRAYGMVYALTHDDLETLYSGPGLDQYRPEAVITHLLDGGDLPALCFNLVEAPASGESNAAYAEKLQDALGKLNFPTDYIVSISQP
jgi:hypothetical protein